MTRRVTTNPWNAVLAHIRTCVGEEEFRRWFSATAYASDSGDQITVWVPTEATRRHLSGHFQHRIDQALAEIDRADACIRFVVAGLDDEEEDD